MANLIVERHAQKIVGVLSRRTSGQAASAW